MKELKTLENLEKLKEKKLERLEKAKNELLTSDKKIEEFEKETIFKFYKKYEYSLKEFIELLERNDDEEKNTNITNSY